MRMRWQCRRASRGRLTFLRMMRRRIPRRSGLKAGTAAEKKLACGQISTSTSEQTRKTHKYQGGVFKPSSYSSRTSRNPLFPGDKIHITACINPQWLAARRFQRCSGMTRGTRTHLAAGHPVYSSPSSTFLPTTIGDRTSEVMLNTP
jgi:hypothetical protein